MTNLDSPLKIRDITNKGPYSQSYGFPVVIYGCESWTIKKAEGQRIDAFEPWCWRRLFLEDSLDTKEIKPVNFKGNQPWISIGRTDVEADAPVLWPHDVKSWLIGKDPDAGKDWGQKEKETTEDDTGITDSMDMSLSKLWEIVKDRKGWHAPVHGVTHSWTGLSDWTTKSWWYEVISHCGFDGHFPDD